MSDYEEARDLLTLSIWAGKPWRIKFSSLTDRAISRMKTPRVLMVLKELKRLQVRFPAASIDEELLAVTQKVQNRVDQIFKNRNKAVRS